MTFKPWPRVANDPIMTELFRRANEAQVSRKDLSERSGVSRMVLSHWVNGRSGSTRMVSWCFEALNQMSPTDRVDALIAELRAEIKK